MRVKTYEKYRVERSIGGRQVLVNEDGSPKLGGLMKSNIRITPEQAETLNEGWDSCEKPLTFYWKEVVFEDAEIVEDKALAESTISRDELKAEADKMGLEYPSNIKTDKLINLINENK
jgi:predicted DNA-binding protein